MKDDFGNIYFQAEEKTAGEIKAQKKPINISQILKILKVNYIILNDECINSIYLLFSTKNIKHINPDFFNNKNYLFYIGLFYFKVLENSEKMILFFEKAIELNEPNSCYYLGHYYEKKNDYINMLYYWQKGVN